MTQATDSLLVAFLDVGQGDCTLLRLPGSNAAVVVDCPEKGSAVATGQLGRWKSDHLLLAILTHSDYDHAGGVVDLIHNLDNRCDALVYSEDRLWRGTELPFKHRLLREELSELMRGGVRRIHPDIGDPVDRLGVVLRFIHPSDADRMGLSDQNYRNEASFVIRVEYMGRSILLGGDVGGRGWKLISSTGMDIRSEVLKVSHHGAWHQDGLSVQEIAQLVEPDTIVFSVGSQNASGHPEPRTVAAYIDRLPTVRVMCTEVTPRCDALPQIRRQQVDAELDGSSAPARRGTGCPCAGSILVEVNKDGLIIGPEVARHDRIIDLFDHPLCRVGRRDGR